MASKRKTLYTSVAKKKLSEIFYQKPSSVAAEAVDILNREGIHLKYRMIHYHLTKIIERNYFLLASKIFIFYI